MSAYRDAAPEPPRVLRYPYLSTGTKFFLVLVVLFGASFLFAAAASSYRAITVTCTRGATCDVVTDGLGGRTIESIPIDAIDGTSLEETHGKHGTSYQLAIETTNGARVLGHTDSLARRKAQEDTLDRFLRGEGPSSITIDYDERQPGGAIFFAALGIGVLLLTWLFFGYAVLSFDLSRATLDVARHHWPLRIARRSYPLADIERADVGVYRGSKGRSVYNVYLAMKDGRREELSKVRTSTRGGHDAKAAEINAILDAWRAR